MIVAIITSPSSRIPLAIPFPWLAVVSAPTAISRPPAIPLIPLISVIPAPAIVLTTSAGPTIPTISSAFTSSIPWAIPAIMQIS